MIAALVDSDVLIEIARGHEPEFGTWTGSAGSDPGFAVSSVSVAELWHGVRRGEESRLRDLFRSAHCFDVTAGIGEAAGSLLRVFSRSHGLALADAIIAATAVTQHLPLWTRNTRHFPMPEIGFYRP